MVLGSSAGIAPPATPNVAVPCCVQFVALVALVARPGCTRASAMSAAAAAAGTSAATPFRLSRLSIFVLLPGGFRTGGRAVGCCVGIAIGPQSTALRMLDAEAKERLITIIRPTHSDDERPGSS